MTTAPTPTLPTPLTLAQVLRIPVLRRLFYAQLVSVFGDFLALFAVINFLTFHLDASARQVTGLQIAYLLPIAVLGILAGVFVDRWPLKPTLVTSDLCRSALCLLLLLATKTWHFYLILAAISVVSSFFGPAQGVAIRGAVPLHGLRAANVLMQQVLFGMRIVGPGIATLIYKLLGPKVCYLSDSVSFIGSATLIATLALTRTYTPPSPTDKTGQTIPTDLAATAADESSPAPTPKTGFASILPDMRQGLSFIVHHAAILFVILALAAAMFIIGCFAPLIAVYVRDVLHARAGIYAVVAPMIGVGMVFGINALNSLAKRAKDATLVYTGLIGIAIGLVILATLPHIWSAILGNLVIGLATSGVMVPAQTLIQRETPPALMGRVGSTVLSVIFTAQIVGLVFSGILANWIGTRGVFALCALILVLLTAAGKLFAEPAPILEKTTSQL